MLAALVFLAIPVHARGQAAPSAAAEHIVEVRVHGNHTTPDAEVLRIAGLTPGDPLGSGTIADVEARLLESGRFRNVEVRKRYASLTDMSAVLIVIVVEEVAGIGIDVPEPGPMRKLRANTMWLPILSREDGYGFTYGARVSFVDLLGRRTRVSAPLTWGGERRAALEIERRFERGPFGRLFGAASISQREHPALGVDDRRTGVSVRAEHSVGSWLTISGLGGVSKVRFGALDDRRAQIGVEAVVDTRRDPAFPRNAVYLAAGFDRIAFRESRDTIRMTMDARGFVGLFGQTVLAVRAFHVRAADPLPPYEQSLLGGAATVRGFPLGFRMGDRLAAGSAELRVPLSSPRHLSRLGVAVFADTGAVYTASSALSDATWDTGVGAGVFLQAPLVSLRLDVARGLGSGTRAHFTLGVTF